MKDASPQILRDIARLSVSGSRFSGVLQRYFISLLIYRFLESYHLYKLKQRKIICKNMEAFLISSLGMRAIDADSLAIRCVLFIIWPTCRCSRKLVSIPRSYFHTSSWCRPSISNKVSAVELVRLRVPVPCVCSPSLYRWVLYLWEIEVNDGRLLPAQRSDHT